MSGDHTPAREPSDIEALRGAIDRVQGSMRWNPDPEEVQRATVKLVLTLVEFLRELMERQAIGRMERKTLTSEQIEALGQALMTLDTTVGDLARQFGIDREELNLALGPLGRLR